MGTPSDVAAGEGGSPSANLAAGRWVRGAADGAIRVVGGAVAVWFGAYSAVVETLLVPLRVGTVRLPLAVLFAAAANVGMIYFARWVTRSRLAAVLPGIAWFAVVMAAGSRTTEGDMVLVGDDLVALALLLVGSAAVAAASYFVMAGPAGGRPPVGANRSGGPRRRGGSAARPVNPEGRT